MALKLYIEEYVENKMKPYIEIENSNSWYDKSFYDPRKHLVFYLFTESESCIHLHKSTTYSFIVNDNTLEYRVWERLDDNHVLLSAYIRNKRWDYVDEIDEALIENLEVLDVDKFILQYLEDN